MSFSAVVLCIIALFITWGGFGVCLGIAVKNKE